jgi:predicted ester cyclase
MLMLPTPWRNSRVGKEEENFYMSVQEQNKALVRRFLEAHAKGDLVVLEEMLAPDLVNHNLPPGYQPDREDYLRGSADYHAAFSNSRYDIEKQIAEGDEVVTSFTARATHDRGEIMGIAPTGKEFEAQLDRKSVV